MKVAMITNIQLTRKGWDTVRKKDTVSIWMRGRMHLGDEYIDTKALADRFARVALAVHADNML